LAALQPARGSFHAHQRREVHSKNGWGATE
jgi:hypothetical protein